MKKCCLTLGMMMMLTACAPQWDPVINNMASQTVDDIACKSPNLETKLWDGLKSYLIEQQQIPEATVMQEALKAQVAKLAETNPRMTQDQADQLSSELHGLIQTILAEAPAGERVETPEQLLILLSAIDVGDRTTVFRSYMQDKVRGNFTRLEKTVQALDVECPADSSGSSDDGSASGGGENPSPEVPIVEPTPQPEPNRDYAFHRAQALAQGQSLAVFGSRWTFATAYQSCQALDTRDLNSQTPDVEGISITGKHSDGVGSKRMIASLSKVQATHPYLRGISGYGEGCFNVRSSPLIYDYGGKPYGTTAATSPIDLFKNNGDGTSVLGIDCSGYVYTAMATAGLRLKSGRPLKASDSWAWGSSSYVEPQNNGLTCLSKITVTPSMSMKAGDIVAVYGHVLIIDRVGADPFGVNSVSNVNDCSKLNSDRFDFTVAQSSPNKGGVGINHFEAKNYLPTSAKMKTGLEKYAYYACLAKFNNKNYTPNVGTLSVTRHKGTSECISPRVTLARESCIQSCSSMQR